MDAIAHDTASGSKGEARVSQPCAERTPATSPTVSRPLVSIGIACYKAERWIGECIESFLAQTLQDFEILISDNGSPDGTYDICLGYAARDPRVHVVRNARNLGVSFNVNRVFELATGEYFCWASAGDYYAPRFLESCVGPMLRDPSLDLVAAQLCRFESDRQRALPDPVSVNGDMASGVERVLHALHGSRDGRLFRGVFRANAIRDFVPLSSRFGQDIILVARLAARGRLRMPASDEPLYYERNAPGTATHTIPAHVRVRHYEPIDGLRAYLFHRTRNLATIWRITLGAARSHAERLRALRGLASLSVRWHRDYFDDLKDIAGIVRGYLAEWFGR